MIKSVIGGLYTVAEAAYINVLTDLLISVLFDELLTREHNGINRTSSLIGGHITSCIVATITTSGQTLSNRRVSRPRHLVGK